MDYKKEIIEMVEKCTNNHRITLKKTRVCALPLSFFLLIRNHVNKFF